MRISQKEKEKELLPILEDNKRLAKLLLSVKDQIREKEKKMRNCIPKGSDVGVKSSGQRISSHCFSSVSDSFYIWDTGL